MRIRQVKPAFWTDAKLVRLPADIRLFYIGTWAIADDAGWFEWEPEQVAIDLHMRESFVRRAMGVLAAAGRIRLYDCGHGEVVHLVEHQRLAGPTRRVETVFQKHMNRCPATFHTSPTIPGPVRSVEVSRGKERNPANDAGLAETVSEPTTKTKFSELVPRPPSVAAGPRQ